MKTIVTLTTKKALGTLGIFMIFMIAAVQLNQVFAQANEMVQNQRIIKGIISDDSGPLSNVNIVLKGTKTGTATNSKGEFTFPNPLNTGDILLISYLGYETHETTINDDTTFIRLSLSEDLIEFSGALNSDKPYKTKRSKQD